VGGENTYRVVQLGYPSVHDGQTGEEDKVDKGMDMALLGEVEVQRATTAAPSRLEVFHDVLEQRQRSEDTDFLPVESDAVRKEIGNWLVADEALFVGLDTVFLRSDKIEECLGASIELMEPSVLAMRSSLLTTFLIKDGEEECAVVQSAVLDRVVQLGNLKTRK
jgi:hypothetical protein